MDIARTYTQIIDDLKNHHRPRVIFGDQDFNQLLQALYHALAAEEWREAEKIFCLLNHSSRPHAIFEGLLCQALNRHSIPSRIKIFALGASASYIIERRNQLALKLPAFYLDAIRALLPTRDAELKEWTLRTIDAMGPQGKPLVEDILRHRPRSWAMLNRHHRHSHDIIERLVSKWGFDGQVGKKT